MLSKSKYCRFVECPRKLWLTVNRPELALEDSSALGRMSKGNDIGDMAMGYFGDFTEVTVTREDGSPDLSAMISKTNELIAQGCEIICEASFSYKGDYCAVDILRREGDGYAIYEVKSSTKEKEIYLVDVAYQRYILEHCGINVTGCYLMVIDNSYVFDGRLDLRGLFKVIDVSEDILPFYANVEGDLAAAHSLLDDPVEPIYGVGKHCLGDNCCFSQHCLAHLPRPSVFDLHGITASRKLELYEQGIVRLEDVATVIDREARTKKRGVINLRKALMQIDHELNDRGTYFDIKGIKKFLDTLFFPLYFLDFEAMQLAVPKFIGTRPYEEIPFQYSLHRIEEEGGEITHTEFLAEPNTDPRRAIAQRLCEDIPTNACVIVYSKGFENSRLRYLADMFPDLSEHLLAIVENVRDIRRPFDARLCYNRAMHGLTSVKIVLPALFPDDPSLDYHGLDGIHNGTDAMSAYPTMLDLPPEEQTALREALLRYCELDTLATVKLWQVLRGAVE